MNLTIIIPAYNEVDRISETLRVYSAACRDRSAEILVVVNGSSDGTEDLVARDFLPNQDLIRMIVIPEVVGKGGALMRGFSEARGDVIGFTDADGATPPDSFLKLVDALESPGIVIGSRWAPGAEVSIPQSRMRRIGSRVFNLVVRIAFGLKITDSQCGAKVMSREVVETVLPRLGSTQWAFDVDLLFQIRRAGYPILELPVQWFDMEGSKVHPVRTPLEMSGSLLRLRLLHSPLHPVVKLWDRTLGIRLYRNRLARMSAIYKKDASS